MKREPYRFDVTEEFELVLTDVYARCTHCLDWQPVQLRRMGDGTVREQPQCAKCRTRYAKEKRAI